MHLFERIRNAAEFSLDGEKNKALTAAFSISVFLLLAITTDIPWHLQTLSYGLGEWNSVLLNGITNIYLGGVTSFGLAIIYSVLSGVAFTNLLGQLRNGKLNKKSLGSILPGFAATGCASCGIGLLGLIGLTGAAASLPLGGDLLKVLGIALLIYALYDMGDPEVCPIS